MPKRTRKPGVRKGKEEERAFVAAFRRKYRATEPGGVPTDVPTWCCFASQTSAVVGPSILGALEGVKSGKICLYFEAEGSVFETTTKQAVRYFHRREPWERQDTYLVAADQTWCVAYTHETVGESDALLIAGDAPVGRKTIEQCRLADAPRP
jgi:hypothetical protein